MKFGVEVVPLGEHGDPRNVVRLAEAAESSGWDGLFVWDHLAYTWGVTSGDPWVILSVVAQATRRLILGTAVTPLPRRRPHVLAHTLATLDVLSEGRMVLGACLGGVRREFSAFGESDDPKQRAAMLEEGLEVMSLLWSGEEVSFKGAYYTLDNVTFSPVPVQRPRVPVWVGGESPPALRRAARWDGWVIGGINEHCEVVKPPEQLVQDIAVIQANRTDDASFEVAITGCSTPGELAPVRAYEAAGATWWLESLSGMRGSLETSLTLVEAGPPG